MSEGERASEVATAALREARRLVQAGEFAAALGELRRVPADAEPMFVRDALYTEAVARRYQGDHDGALDTIARLLEHTPGYGRAWQERAYNHVAQEQAGPALAAFEQAVRLNASLMASWKALAGLYNEAGSESEARRATQQVQRLSALPPELLSVTSYLNENDLARAEALCRQFLQRNRHHIEGMRLLAEIGVRTDILDDAEFLLESAVEFEPDHDRTRFDYANVLLKRQKFEKAHEQAKALAERDPDNLAVMSLLASARAGVGDNAGAIELYNEVLAESPSQNKVSVMRGHAQKTVGQLDDAIASYRHGYNIDPYYGDAFWSLANTKTYRFSDEEIAHMVRYEADPAIALEDRVHMCFALGKAHEDAGDFAEAFACYARGNALKHQELRYRNERMHMRVDAQIRVCTPALFEQHEGCGHDAPDPIFVVGLPRAGSTLLEQILASHSQVDGTLELPHVLGLVNRLRGDRGPGVEQDVRYPKILQQIDTEFFERFGKQYIDETRVFRAGAPRFIDKMPNNFLHIGLIRLILPNAKIIDARRHPMACCFSGFKQLFGQGQEFSYSQTSIGDYYRRYVELMAHWDSVLPGFVLRVNHESVVDDLETEVRRILAFCELPFEQGCLAFHRTERNVRTPSSQQVRQPIYRSGLDHWRNFEPWLDELKTAVGAEILASYGVEPPA